MRLIGKGLTEGAAPVTFTFDGRPLEARAGETVAAALLANDIALVARSFKYHRPRGLWGAGSEEPNALMTVGAGADAVPNTRATMQEVFDGLQVISQNRFPSLKRDLMAVNDRLWPLFSAGFYYKTFMWPRAFWEGLYEPMIRRAAGLGALSPATPGQTSEKAFAFCDLLVIGAGPAGLMAALTAARAGADVILADEDSRMGGRLLAEADPLDGAPAPLWADGVLAELASLPNVRLMPRTTVTSVHDHGTFGALERVSLHRPAAPGTPRECFWRIVARRAILAAGAIERPIAFPDNDRPGIMSAGAVRAYVNRWGVAPGQTITIFGNNDDAHRTARDLAQAGLRIAALIDSRPGVAPPGDWPVFSGGRITATQGRHRLDQITVTHDGGTRTIRTDCLAVSGGWNPALHLTCHLGARPVWDDRLAAFLPAPDAVPGMDVAGAAAGRLSTQACLEDGVRAGRAAAEALGLRAEAPEIPVAEDRPIRITPLWAIPGRGRAWLDLQNDVTVKDVGLAAQEGFTAVEHMKRYTTQGMATDQGKSSNVPALAVLADVTGRAIPEVGTTTFRPPYTPVSIAAMGAGGEGKGFAPVRRTTSDAAARERGAVMIEAGLWYRASWFPRPGETTWRQSCDREVAMVRGAVGVCDVSTLGKIDIQGPDAGAFLDFLYTNTISTLPVGRVRYGLMLREDGHVMDDGTVARLSERQFVLTTTTAAAGLVMRQVDLAAQRWRPDLDVQAVSVTEHWAQFAVAGPLAPRLIAALAPGATGLAHLGCGTCEIAGVGARIFRISFSGEIGYEVAVPARHGAALWRLLVAQAEALGGGAYGLEALNVMRIEKGFLTHAELHGRTTAHDLGLAKMLSTKKEFVGRALAQRPGLTDPARERLVGLVPVDPAAQITAGAHLFEEGAEAVRVNDLGYVTSVCHSPTLGHSIALAFLQRGPDRWNEVVVAVDHLRGLKVPVRVCDPVFLDPEGARING